MIAVTIATTDASDANATEELSCLLQRAGIVLPPERIAEVAAEYIIFRKDVAMVNDEYSPNDEPSLIFVAGES
jgi:hypothetical protein